MPWPQTGVTQYHAQFGLPDKGRAIEGLVVCNKWDLEPLVLLNGLALVCYQPSPEVLMVYKYWTTLQAFFQRYGKESRQTPRILKSTDFLQLWPVHLYYMSLTNSSDCLFKGMLNTSYRFQTLHDHT